jgi:hypothetical protein
MASIRCTAARKLLSPAIAFPSEGSGGAANLVVAGHKSKEGFIMGFSQHLRAALLTVAVLGGFGFVSVLSLAPAQTSSAGQVSAVQASHQEQPVETVTVIGNRRAT